MDSKPPRYPSSSATGAHDNRPASSSVPATTIHNAFTPVPTTTPVRPLRGFTQLLRTEDSLIEEDLTATTVTATTAATAASGQPSSQRQQQQPQAPPQRAGSIPAINKPRLHQHHRQQQQQPRQQSSEEAVASNSEDNLHQMVNSSGDNSNNNPATEIGIRLTSPPETIPTPAAPQQSDGSSSWTPPSSHVGLPGTTAHLRRNTNHSEGGPSTSNQRSPQSTFSAQLHQRSRGDMDNTPWQVQTAMPMTLCSEEEEALGRALSLLTQLLNAIRGSGDSRSNERLGVKVAYLLRGCIESLPVVVEWIILRSTAPSHEGAERNHRATPTSEMSVLMHHQHLQERSMLGNSLSPSSIPSARMLQGTNSPLVKGGYNTSQVQPTPPQSHIPVEALLEAVRGLLELFEAQVICVDSDCDATIRAEHDQQLALVLSRWSDFYHAFSQKTPLVMMNSGKNPNTNPPLGMPGTPQHQSTQIALDMSPRSHSPETQRAIAVSEFATAVNSWADLVKNREGATVPGDYAIEYTVSNTLVGTTPPQQLERKWAIALGAQFSLVIVSVILAVIAGVQASATVGYISLVCIVFALIPMFFGRQAYVLSTSRGTVAAQIIDSLSRLAAASIFRSQPSHLTEQPKKPCGHLLTGGLAASFRATQPQSGITFGTNATPTGATLDVQGASVLSHDPQNASGRRFLMSRGQTQMSQQQQMATQQHQAASRCGALSISGNTDDETASNSPDERMFAEQPVVEDAVEVRMDETGTLLLPFSFGDPIILDGYHVHAHLSIIGVELSQVFTSVAEQLSSTPGKGSDDRGIVCLWNHATVECSGGFANSDVMGRNVNEVLADAASANAVHERIRALEREILAPSQHGLPQDPIMVKLIHKTFGVVAMKITIAPVTAELTVPVDKPVTGDDDQPQPEDRQLITVMIGALLVGVPFDHRVDTTDIALRTVFLAEALEQLYMAAADETTNQQQGSFTPPQPGSFTPLELPSLQRNDTQENFMLEVQGISVNEPKEKPTPRRRGGKNSPAVDPLRSPLPKTSTTPEPNPVPGEWSATFEGGKGPRAIAMQVQSQKRHRFNQAAAAWVLTETRRGTPMLSKSWEPILSETLPHELDAALLTKDHPKDSESPEPSMDKLSTEGSSSSFKPKVSLRTRILPGVPQVIECDLQVIRAVVSTLLRATPASEEEPVQIIAEISAATAAIAVRLHGMSASHSEDILTSAATELGDENQTVQMELVGQALNAANCCPVLLPPSNPDEEGAATNHRTPGDCDVLLLFPFRPHTGGAAGWRAMMNQNSSTASSGASNLKHSSLFGEVHAGRYGASAIRSAGTLASFQGKSGVEWYRRSTLHSNSTQQTFVSEPSSDFVSPAATGITVMISDSSEVARHRFALVLWHDAHSVVPIPEDNFRQSGEKLLRSGRRRIDAVMLSVKQPITTDLVELVRELAEVVFCFPYHFYEMMMSAVSKLQAAHAQRRKTVPFAQSRQASSYSPEELGMGQRTETSALETSVVSLGITPTRPSTSSTDATSGVSSSAQNPDLQLDPLVQCLVDLESLNNVVFAPAPPQAPSSAERTIKHITTKVHEIRQSQKRRAEIESLLKTHRGGPWTRGKLLGKGTFGDVYEANFSLTGGKMAVKTIRLEGDIAEQEVLLNEIRTLSLVEHPNIVHYFHCEQSENEHELNIFMELCPGGSLASVLQRSPTGLDIDEVASITSQILLALDCLHARGIAHRDLKPANVLLSESRAKLADFGTAAVVISKNSKRRKSLDAPLTELAGTLQWMAPEVFAGQHYGLPCDVFSVGVLVLDLLKIVPPVLSKRADIICLGGVDSDAELWEGLVLPSPVLSDFLHGCLRVRPRDRVTVSTLLHHPFVAEAHRTFGLVQKKISNPNLLNEEAMALKSKNTLSMDSTCGGVAPAVAQSITVTQPPFVAAVTAAGSTKNSFMSFGSFAGEASPSPVFQPVADTVFKSEENQWKPSFALQQMSAASQELQQQRPTTGESKGSDLTPTAAAGRSRPSSGAVRPGSQGRTPNQQQISSTGTLLPPIVSFGPAVHHASSAPTGPSVLTSSTGGISGQGQPVIHTNTAAQQPHPSVCGPQLTKRLGPLESPSQVARKVLTSSRKPESSSPLAQYSKKVGVSASFSRNREAAQGVVPSWMTGPISVSQDFVKPIRAAAFDSTTPDNRNHPRQHQGNQHPVSAYHHHQQPPRIGGHNTGIGLTPELNHSAPTLGSSQHQPRGSAKGDQPHHGSGGLLQPTAPAQNRLFEEPPEDTVIMTDATEDDDVNTSGSGWGNPLNETAAFRRR